MNNSELIVLVRYLFDEAVECVLDLGQAVRTFAFQSTVKDQDHPVQTFFDYVKCGCCVYWLIWIYVHG
jgi:hypothetical protein